MFDRSTVSTRRAALLNTTADAGLEFSGLKDAERGKESEGENKLPPTTPTVRSLMRLERRDPPTTAMSVAMKCPAWLRRDADWVLRGAEGDGS